MNVFLIVLVFLFMASYYYLGAPSMRTDIKTTEEVLEGSDAAAATSCVVAVHRAASELARAEDDVGAAIDANPCAARFKVSTTSVCLRNDEVVRGCRVDPRDVDPMQKYVITKSSWVGPEMSGLVMDSIRRRYRNLSGLGMLMTAEGQDEFGEAFRRMAILSVGRRPVWLSESLVSAASLETGDLVYLTQYTTDELQSEQIRREAGQLICAPGEVKVFRFRTWRCERPTPVMLCQGDMVFDRELGECVPNFSARPICGGNETAVIIEGAWTCQLPTDAIECPHGRAPSFDFETLEWVCIGDPLAAQEENKCAPVRTRRGILGTAAPRAPVSHCNDCEAQVQDPETCEFVCIPDRDKLMFKGCYPNAAECDAVGGHKAFYFGFPNDLAYIQSSLNNVAGLAAAGIPQTANHSANRKFNCLDCSPFKVDLNTVFHPYVASCRFEGTHSSVCGPNALYVPNMTIGARGKCESLETLERIVPPCPPGYARATQSAACSPNWCGGDSGRAGVYCGALRPLMVLSGDGCAYCINPREDQIPRLLDLSIDISKNAGNNGWNGNLRLVWGAEHGYEMPVVPGGIPGFELFGGRIFAYENIFDQGRVIDLIDSVQWGDQTGMPVPMPIAVPQNMLNCRMQGPRCAPDQVSE
ncbi:MAG: hypothetical protein FWD33_01670 [Alphaproteobacteria bacterium]|nr:hypothetical protein [Alphaproteobacteria bacterium]